MLGDITLESIKVNVLCENWEDAIKKGCKLLENKGYVEPEYEYAIIKSLKNIGPYMVIAPNIVLSHGRPEDGVNKTAVSFLTLKKPIDFGSEQNDPVKLVITLAAKDNKSHIGVLGEIVDLLRNKEDLQKIMNSKTEKEVLNILTKYS
ncbi:PTS sugar transporter subunit IIA [Clostridium fallax]|uniref:Ascorbate-specific PTS system EIIA component n=1 Tax=Clostridium fallax TaxID=1533 RepID=A0A1M4SIU5_9CLOT|nr:PTS sugar transporter subunit IIA [Clostridium fallax]SHE32131.1 PTS system IIA component, L-Asc family [Clostridium fallax]SQB07848.1 phosphotransferase system mannitol/fructose-specific IIA domain-containing protein [Clostridium fallax]